MSHKKVWNSIMRRKKKNKLDLGPESPSSSPGTCKFLLFFVCQTRHFSIVALFCQAIRTFYLLTITAAVQLIHLLETKIKLFRVLDKRLAYVALLLERDHFASCTVYK